MSQTKTITPTPNLSQQTQRIYNRELTRLQQLGIQYEKRPSITPLLKRVVKLYKSNGVPFENMRLCLFAIRNFYLTGPKTRKPHDMNFFLKDNLQQVKDDYIRDNIRQPREKDVTDISWSDIVEKTRPIIEDDTKPYQDRLILALYTLIPPRRSDYGSMIYTNQDAEGNTLNPSTGLMTIRDYKTVRKYGPYTINLFETGPLIDDNSRRLFRDVIGEANDGPVFKTKSGTPLTQSSFTKMVANIFSKYLQDRVTLIDIRRAFDQHIRDTILNNAHIPIQERHRIRQLIEMATSHSREMTGYYADKVDLS